MRSHHLVTYSIPSTTTKVLNISDCSKWFSRPSYKVILTILQFLDNWRSIFPRCSLVDKVQYQTRHRNSLIIEAYARSRISIISLCLKIINSIVWWVDRKLFNQSEFGLINQCRLDRFSRIFSSVSLMGTIQLVIRVYIKPFAKRLG